MITECSNLSCRADDQALTCSRTLPLTYCYFCGTFGLDVEEIYEPPQLYTALRAVYDAAGPEMVFRRQTAAMIASMCPDDQRPILLLYCQLCHSSQLDHLKTDLKSKERVWDDALIEQWVGSINNQIPYDQSVTRYLVRALAYAYYRIDVVEDYGGARPKTKQGATLSIKRLTARPTCVTAGEPVIIEWEATGHTELTLSVEYEGEVTKRVDVRSEPGSRYILVPSRSCSVILEARRDNRNIIMASVDVTVKTRLIMFDNIIFKPR